MRHLRGGIKVNGKPLSATALDALAELPQEQAETAPLRDIFDAIGQRAGMIVSAGLEGGLTLADLSLYEIYAIAVARSEARKAERELLAATIAAASRLEASDLIKDVPGAAEARFNFDFERRAWAIVEGGV